MRARTSASSGEANGSFSMITSRSAVALDVDALPEARRAEQHAVAIGAKFLEQSLARRLALDEQPERLFVLPARAQQRGALRQRPVTGEQHEGAATGATDERLGGVDDRRHITRRRRVGQSLRQQQQALPLVIERAVDAQRGRLSRVRAAR